MAPFENMTFIWSGVLRLDASRRALKCSTPHLNGTGSSWEHMSQIGCQEILIRAQAARWGCHWILIAPQASKWGCLRILIGAQAARWGCHWILIAPQASRWGCLRILIAAQAGVFHQHWISSDNLKKIFLLKHSIHKYLCLISHRMIRL